MNAITDDNAGEDTAEFARLVVRTVLAIGPNLGITVTEPAKASGAPRSSGEAIERGGAATCADPNDIAVPSVGSPTNAAKKLTTQAQPVLRVEGARPTTVNVPPPGMTVAAC